MPPWSFSIPAFQQDKLPVMWIEETPISISISRASAKGASFPCDVVASIPPYTHIAYLSPHKSRPKGQCR